MGKCDCYEEHNICICTNPPQYNHYGVCLGTKEQDRCSCGGDESKCNFYPEKRKAAEKKMNTAEMWLKAQENGKTYICNSVLYNKKTGFISATGLKPWPISAFDNIENLMKAQWSLYQEEIMTKAEAEKKFGIRIVG